MQKLLLKFNAAVIKEIPLSKSTLSVGRKPDNDLVIENPAVSGHHCRITVQNGSVFVEDLESTNGTFVNDKRVKKAGLRHHDIISVAKHTLVFIEAEPPTMPLPISPTDAPGQVKPKADPPLPGPKTQSPVVLTPKAVPPAGVPKASPPPLPGTILPAENLPKASSKMEFPAANLPKMEFPSASVPKSGSASGALPKFEPVTESSAKPATFPPKSNLEIDPEPQPAVDKPEPAALKPEPMAPKAEPAVDKLDAFDPLVAKPESSLPNVKAEVVDLALSQETESKNDSGALPPKAVATERRQAWLRILKGVIGASEYELRGTSTYIGKSDRVQIPIKGAGLFGSAPEVAASIHRKTEGFVLVAVTDKYPLVNGSKISGSVLLKEGDLIDCGATTMQFEMREIT